MPLRQVRLIQAWIEIHREELMADWTLAICGETLVKIDTLRQEKPMNPRIIAVTAHDDYTLLLTFANGEVRHFDMTPYLGYPAFEPLRQVAFLSWHEPATAPPHGQKKLTSTLTLFTSKADLRSSKSKQRN